MHVHAKKGEKEKNADVSQCQSRSYTCGTDVDFNADVNILVCNHMY